MTYIDKEGNEQPIDVEAAMSEKELGYILANSVQAKETIRTAFEIPPLPSTEEIEEVEKERLNKRKKKKEKEEKDL
jgi:hypothetical protein